MDRNILTALVIGNILKILLQSCHKIQFFIPNNQTIKHNFRKFHKSWTKFCKLKCRKSSILKIVAYKVNIFKITNTGQYLKKIMGDSALKDLRNRFFVTFLRRRILEPGGILGIFSYLFENYTNKFLVKNSRITFSYNRFSKLPLNCTFKTAARWGW